MKTYFGILAILLTNLIIGGNIITAQETSIIDNRDGQEYKVMNAGGQTWMAENLNFETEGSWAYGDKKKNANQYGKLYSWASAQNACPTGWHLPTAKEWQELIDFHGGDLEAGLALRIDGNSAFNADYAGFRSKDGEFLDMGHDVNFWTATNCDDQDAWRCYIDRGFNTVVQDYFDKEGGLSVRCVKDFGNNELVDNSK